MDSTATNHKNKGTIGHVSFDPTNFDRLHNCFGLGTNMGEAVLYCVQYQINT